LFAGGTCAFIRKLDEIIFVKIQGKQITFEPFIYLSKNNIKITLKLNIIMVSINIMVLSANKIGMALGKSLMYTRNDNGLNAAPHIQFWSILRL
jgi:hypothetical protein